MSAESKILNKATHPAWLSWLVVTLVFGIVTFLASPNAPLGGFWGVQVQQSMPAGSQRLLFILLGLIQSIAFGLGIAFLLFGFPLATARTSSRRLARLTQFAITWSLVSWWPHSSFHQAVSPDHLSGLLAIEYGFHVSLILAGLVVAYFFVKTLQQENEL